MKPNYENCGSMEKLAQLEIEIKTNKKLDEGEKRILLEMIEDGKDLHDMILRRIKWVEQALDEWCRYR